MNEAVAAKTSAGRFFEDFAVGQRLVHATPRTIGAGDVALYSALFGPRFAVQSADTFAAAIGYPKSPVDDLLTFHVVFGKSVPRSPSMRSPISAMPPAGFSIPFIPATPCRRFRRSSG